MKVYIQCDKTGMPYNVNAYGAMRGFQQMGFETVLYYAPEEIKDSQRKDVIVGGVGRVKSRLEQLEILIEDIDYPQELERFYGRKIWKTDVQEIIHHAELWPVFLKPLEGKLFPGICVWSERDFIGRFCNGEKLQVYCSELLNFEEEWRCFVRYGEILDIRRYSGTIGRNYDIKAVQKAVEGYLTAPAGYAMDIAVTDHGETVIVEINDGYSLGSYGLDPLLYAKLLSARWAQLTDTEDECKF